MEPSLKWAAGGDCVSFVCLFVCGVGVSHSEPLWDWILRRASAAACLSARIIIFGLKNKLQHFGKPHFRTCVCVIFFSCFFFPRHKQTHTSLQHMEGEGDYWAVLAGRNKVVFFLAFFVASLWLVFLENVCLSFDLQTFNMIHIEIIFIFFFFFIYLRTPVDKIKNKPKTLHLFWKQNLFSPLFTACR